MMNEQWTRPTGAASVASRITPRAPSTTSRTCSRRCRTGFEGLTVVQSTGRRGRVDGRSRRRCRRAEPPSWRSTRLPNGSTSTRAADRPTSRTSSQPCSKRRRCRCRIRRRRRPLSRVDAQAGSWTATMCSRIPRDRDARARDDGARHRRRHRDGQPRLQAGRCRAESSRRRGPGSGDRLVLEAMREGGVRARRRAERHVILAEHAQRR